MSTLMHARVNVGSQGKSDPGKIHEVILVIIKFSGNTKHTRGREEDPSNKATSGTERPCYHKG